MPFTCYWNHKLLKMSKLFSYTWRLTAINHFPKHSAVSPITFSFPVTVHTNTPMTFGEQSCSLLLCPALMAWWGKDGNAGWDITISFDYLLRKNAFGTLLLKLFPSHALRNTTNQIQLDELQEPWIQREENKKGRLICCPSNPDYLFKTKFNFLIKCWKKFLQHHDYSWNKVQGTNKLPPPAPSQTVLAA